MPKIKRRTSGALRQEVPQIEGVMHQVMDLYDRYRTVIISTLAALGAIVIVGGGFLLYQSHRDQKASDILSQAMAYYDPAASGGRPDYGKALDLFRRAGTEYGGTMNGAVARYYIGNCLLEMGHFAEAVKQYEDFIKHPSGDGYVLGLVYQRLGYALAVAGNREEAIAAFEKAESRLGTGMATSELARLYEQDGRGDEARRKYQAIADGLRGTVTADAAKGKIGNPEVQPQLPLKKESSKGR